MDVDAKPVATRGGASVLNRTTDVVLDVIAATAKTTMKVAIAMISPNSENNDLTFFFFFALTHMQKISEELEKRRLLRVLQMVNLLQDLISFVNI